MMLECRTRAWHSRTLMNAGGGSQPTKLDCWTCPQYWPLVTVWVACRWMLECRTGSACVPLVTYVAAEIWEMVLVC